MPSSDFKAFHTGGGGNCVFFSTAKQLNSGIHQNVRDELLQMYKDDATKQLVKDTAKELIKNQFKAGFANTTLNWELHDYNFKGKDASDKVIGKLTSDKNSELNDALALRMLMQLKGGDSKNYLGKSNGSKMDIYTPIDPGFAKDVLQVLSGVSPKDAPLPALLTIAALPQPDAYVTRLFQMEGGEVKESQINDLTHPTKDSLDNFLSENGAGTKDVIGLRGSGNHCKAFINTEIKALGENSCLNIVSAESRGASRGIKGFFKNIFENVKSGISKILPFGERKISQEPTSKLKPKQKEAEIKDSSKDKTDDGFSLVDMEDGLDIAKEDDGFDIIEIDNTIEETKSIGQERVHQPLSVMDGETKLNAKTALSKDNEPLMSGPTKD